MNFKKCIKLKELKRSTELLDCLRLISSESSTEVVFFKMIRIITTICDKAVTFDQSLLIGELIANHAKPSIDKKYELNENGKR